MHDIPTSYDAFPFYHYITTTIAIITAIAATTSTSTTLKRHLLNYY